MDSEGIMLSELSQRKINTVLLSFKYGYFKQKNNWAPREQTGACQGEGERREAEGVKKVKKH